MTPWFWAAFALIPAGVVCLRGSTMQRVIGLQTASVVYTILLLVLAEAFGNAFFYDVSLTLAVLNLAGGLTFLRYLEKWM